MKCTVVKQPVYKLITDVLIQVYRLKNERYFLALNSFLAAYAEAATAITCLCQLRFYSMVTPRRLKDSILLDNVIHEHRMRLNELCSIP